MGLSSEAVLIATLGSEPQVVTAALDLLLARGYAVRRVRVLHTAPPEGPAAGAANVLRQSFAEQPYAPPVALTLEPLREAGRTLADVQTPAAGEAATARAGRLLLYRRSAILRGRPAQVCAPGGDRKSGAPRCTQTAQYAVLFYL